MGEYTDHDTSVMDVSERPIEPKRPSGEAYLVALGGEEIGATYAIGTHLIVGRSSECDLQVTDDSLSRQHARIYPRNTGLFVIEDLQSRNGTWVNGERVGTHELRDGDRIQIGRRMWKFVWRDEIEAQLRDAQRMEAIGSLAAGVAHDFNNLLVVIQGGLSYLQMLFDQDKVKLSPDASETIDDMLTASERAAGLTRQLLGFARRGKFEQRPVDASAVMAEAVRLSSRTFDRLIGIESRIEPGAKVLGDRSQIQQMLLNLCVNARDAMAGGGEIRLSTREATVDDEYRPDAALADGRYVVITVEDTGVGMEPEVVERAFEPFFTTKGPGEGTGLGLASVYGVMKQHDGAVVVRSEIGVGSVFEAFFPIAKGPLVANGADEIEAAGGTETILVAEDSRAVRESVVQLLKAEGYSVLVAENGAEAVEVFTANPDIDLVLLDVVMPYKTGPEAQREMAQMGRKARYLFTSGYSDGALPARMQSEGLRLLAKPYTPDQLLVELRRALDSD